MQTWCLSPAFLRMFLNPFPLWSSIQRASWFLAPELAHNWENFLCDFPPLGLSLFCIFCGFSLLPQLHTYVHCVYLWVCMYESIRKPCDIYKVFHPCACACCGEAYCKSSFFEDRGLIQEHGCMISLSHWYSTCTKTSNTTALAIAQLGPVIQKN